MTDRDSYRHELIQVAAVAIAAIQNLDNGTATLKGFQGISVELFKERTFQIAKWGAQNRHPYLWMTILGEEFGESCKAAFDESMGEKLQ